MVLTMTMEFLLEECTATTMITIGTRFTTTPGIMDLVRRGTEDMHRWGRAGMVEALLDMAVAVAVAVEAGIGDDFGGIECGRNQHMKYLRSEKMPRSVFLAALLGVAKIVCSQQVVAPPVAAAPPAVQLNDAQLQTLLAPIALYPDALLAQILPASTYPLQIVLAQRWLQANPNPSGAMIDGQNFEPSIKALLHYPTVLAMLNNQLEWTQSLGVAFLNQQPQVMNAIQELRQRARAAGALQSTPQQQVVTGDDDLIEIVPTNPDVIYVPEYDGLNIYAGGALAFGIGYPEGLWLDNSFDWHHHWVASGAGWHHGWDNPIGDPHRRGEPPLTHPWEHNPAQPLPVRSPAAYEDLAHRVGPGYEPHMEQDTEQHARAVAEPRTFDGYQDRSAVQRQVERAEESRPVARQEPVRSLPEPSEPERSEPVRSEPVRSEPVRSEPAQVFRAQSSGRSAAAASVRGNESRSGGGGGGRRR
jgi:hypothetical protein